MFYYPPPPSPPQQGEKPNSNTPATSDCDTNSGYHYQQQRQRQQQQQQQQYHHHPHYPNYHPHQDQEYSTSASYPQIQDHEYHASSTSSTNTNTNSHLHHSPYCPPIVYHPPNPNQLGGLGTYAYAVSQSVSSEITPFDFEESTNLPSAHHQAYQDLEPIPLNRISKYSFAADGQQRYNSQHQHTNETPFAETCPQARTRFASTSGQYVNDANVPSLPAHAQDPVPASASNIGSKSARESLPFSSSASARALPHINSSGTGTSRVGGEGGAWENMFRELTEYKRANGHTDVPQKYSDNATLGNWVNKQRMEHKNRIEGKNSSLNNTRMARLEGIGFRWAKRRGQANWDEKFNELLQYMRKFGNCYVPTKYKDNTALGRWVSTQRAEYKKYQEGNTKTFMTDEKIRRLEAIGFAWSVTI